MAEGSEGVQQEEAKLRLKGSFITVRELSRSIRRLGIPRSSVHIEEFGHF